MNILKSFLKQSLQSEIESRSALLGAAYLFILVLSLIALFNYTIDPMCYYHCTKIDTNRKHSNLYYQEAQRAVYYSNTQQVVLGSSRASSSSPYFLQKHTGLKTLNLSVGGAELSAKLTFLEIARQHNRLERVIWYADYFENIMLNADVRLKLSPALIGVFNQKYGELSDLKSRPSLLTTLVDHVTLEASFRTLRNKSNNNFKNELGGMKGEYESCDQGEFKPKKSNYSLSQEVDLLYENYTHKIFVPPQSPNASQMLESALKDLSQDKIKIVVIVPPYHPIFTERLRLEFPKIYQGHLDWIKSIRKTENENIAVHDYFTSGIPGDDASPLYWNDGVHFTCYAAMKLLTHSLKLP